MNDWLRVENLDYLEKDRKMAHIQSVAYKEKIKKYFHKQIRLNDFYKGDLVLRKINGPKKQANEGKMITN